MMKIKEEIEVQVILSHVNTDFDALASMIAAKKLYPEATVVLSDRQDVLVKRFLNIYRDTLPLVPANRIDWKDVTEIILVDVASLKRTGSVANKINENVQTIVYDHHPRKRGDVQKDGGTIELVGATVTLLIEEIQRRSLSITPFEATLFGLGIYTDTGSFTYNNTTTRDFAAALFLLENGMSLDMVQRFSEQTLELEQRKLLDELFVKAETIEKDGLEVVIATCYNEEVVSGLATITRKLLELKDVDALITVVGMKKHVFVVGRASANRISLQPLLKKLGGGGHKHAGSATIKNADYTEIYEQVKENVRLIMQPATTARELMASPVKTITPETTIEEAGEKMYRYGHSGYPVVENSELVGMITRRDLDKANHHGLGHAPVKAYMSTNIITITPETTLEEVQQTIIEHNIGRLPVLENGELIGIISRTDIIGAIHEQAALTEDESAEEETTVTNISTQMKEQLPGNIYRLLKEIGTVAQQEKTAVYLIGGIVRDLLLQHPNDDVDIVVEGNGIHFAKQLQRAYGGELIVHEQFGTATWRSADHIEVDIATSRLEYYDKPAALPDVESSTLREDLYRRDFTINAIAVYLNEDKFGDIVDPFSGQADLNERHIRVLHNISFVEDPTRILRAVRFELRFNFRMDEQTETLAQHSMDKMKDVSNERIVAEIERLFVEADAVTVIDRLYELSFWQQFGNTEINRAQIEQHTVTLQNVYEQYVSLLTFDERDVWMAYFLIPFYYNEKLTKAKPFLQTKKGMKLLNEIKSLQKSNLFHKNVSLKQLHETCKHYTNEAVLFFAAHPEIDKAKIIHYVKKRDAIPTYLTGEDLRQRGMKPSPLYSDIFLQLEIATLTDEVTNKQEAEKWLEQYLQQIEQKER